MYTWSNVHLFPRCRDTAAVSAWSPRPAPCSSWRSWPSCTSRTGSPSRSVNNTNAMQVDFKWFQCIWKCCTHERGQGVHGIAGALGLLLHSGAVVLLGREDLGPDDPHGDRELLCGYFHNVMLLWNQRNREGKEIQPQLTNVSTVYTENGRLHAQHHFVPHPQCVLCMFDP